MASNDFLNQLKSSIVVRVIGGVAVLAVAGWFVATRVMPHEPAQDASAAVQHAPAPAAVSAAPASAPAPAAANNVTVKPAAAGKGATSVSVASHGAGDGNTAPVVTAVGQPMAPNAPHLDEHLTYQYNALGRRDPFQSLVDGQFVGADVGGDAPLDPGGVKVVGIVWGASDQFALVEDVRGNSFVLRKGDKVQNGFVEGLKRDGVIVNITAEGQSQSVVIPLTRKGEQNAR
jgi:hypothetical protein